MELQFFPVFLFSLICNISNMKPCFQLHEVSLTSFVSVKEESHFASITYMH